MKKKSLFLICSIILMVTSCKPVYETKYKFVAPKNQSARSCLNTCIKNKDNCINTCQQSSSRLDITDKVISMFSNIPRNSSKNKRMKDCENRCNESFRQCYVNCGGQVIKKAGILSTYKNNG